jgi:hypothetical protein
MLLICLGLGCSEFVIRMAGLYEAVLLGFSTLDSKRIGPLTMAELF